MRANCRAASHRRRLLASLAGALVAMFVLAAVGCASTSSIPKTVTDLKQVVGQWDGWIGSSGGVKYAFRATMQIRDDGTWVMPIERNPTYHGKIGIVDGAVRWGSPGPKDPWYGTVTMVEENGPEYLILLRPNGEVWTEFNRAK
jgi:hypothetical protein